MKVTNKRSGISLIVLVITIIVIVILAVAVILTLSNNNPIENAKEAVSANDEATLKEEATLLYADWYLKENTEGDTGMTAQEYVEEYLSDGYDKDLTDRLTVSDSGVITISEPLNKVEDVVIPKGFKHVTGTTVSTGLVIKNKTDGNEFVWVPVEKGSFTREGFGTDISSYSEPYETTDYTSEREEYDAMVASVEKYGGFYIGRYEASDNGSGKAQSIGNKEPWYDITWGDSMTEIGTTGAVAKARAVYPASSANQGDAVSTLPYGVQWDATVKFILTKYPEKILTDSSQYGNYDDVSNYESIPTGSNPQYALNNIYDMAGNVQEWTMEAESSGCRVARGGSYFSSGSGNPVSDRYYDYPAGSFFSLGFRLALYIK